MELPIEQAHECAVACEAESCLLAQKAIPKVLWGGLGAQMSRPSQLVFAGDTWVDQRLLSMFPVSKARKDRADRSRCSLT
jgi:hypothetical protein